MLLRYNFIYFFLIFFYLLLISFFWNEIQLPFHNENNVIGTLSAKGINPLNDTFKFFLFVAPTLIISLIFLKQNYSNKFINFKDFFNQDVISREELNIKDVAFFFILFSLLIILEFLTIDFSRFIHLDTLHDGDYLTPLINYENYEGYWSKSFTIHGGRDLFIPIVIFKLFETTNIAPVKFLYISLILPLKFLSVILAYQISNISNLKKIFKIIIFFLSSIFLLSMSKYDQNYYLSIRDIFVLVFFIFFIKILLQKKNYIINFLLILTSTGALFFHYDTGIYLILILIFYFIYLIVGKKYSERSSFIISIFICAMTVYFYFGKIEIINFIEQITHIVKNIDRIHGMEYPQPFFSIGENDDASRATKLLLFFIIFGFFFNILIFLKNDYLHIKDKVLISFIYLYSLISFKNALGRSDGGHIMISSDWITILLFYLFLFSTFFYLNVKIKKNYSQKTISIILLFLIVVSIFYKFQNKTIYEASNNIRNFISTSNSEFISNERKVILKKISALVKDEKCINNFTSDLSIPYLINKPTCTKFFSSWIVSGKKIEKKYLKQLEESTGNYLIYNSPYFIVDQIPTNKRLPIADTFIKNNYFEAFNYQNYVILKKNN